MWITRLAPLLLVLFVTLPWMVAADESTEEESHVLVLDTTNFTDVVKQHSFVVVEFYAPWCGHCKRLAPEYEKAAAALKSHEPAIVLAKVDANEEANKPLASEYEIRGFPTLKIFENQGSIIREYKGPRDAEGIVSYLKKQVGPASEEITSLEQGQKLVEENEILVVGVFSSYDSEEFKNFSAIANELRSDFEFKHTLDASFVPEKDTKLSGSVIRIFKKFDEGYNDLTNFEINAAKEFLDQVSIPYVVLFNKDPVQRGYLSKVFSKPEDTKAFLFVDASDESAAEIKSIYGEIAKEYRGKGLRFLIADTEDGMNAIQYFGVQKEKLPAIIVQGSDEKKYMLEEAKTNKIVEWFKNYLEGKIPVFYKSEPVPEKNDEPTKVVVLETFESMVLNSGKNVLIEFYAPWCGHCKKLAPILDEVATALKSDSDVVIAKYDATANDIKHKEFDVKGFPTLYFRTASGKLVPYEGDRSKEDLIKFINENKETVSDTDTVKAEVEASSKDEL